MLSKLHQGLLVDVLRGSRHINQQILFGRTSSYVLVNAKPKSEGVPHRVMFRFFRVRFASSDASLPYESQNGLKTT